MNIEEAIKYLEPIANSASLKRYKDALGIVIDAIRAQIDSWISVKDRYPDESMEGKVVIVCIKTRYDRYRASVIHWWGNPRAIEWQDVTHWRPLPEPPRRKAMAEYIEREALMKNFCGYDLTKCVKYGNESQEQQLDSYSTMMMYEIADEIEDAPADEVAPVRHGRWEPSGYCEHRPNRKRNTDKWTTYKCSECGFSNGRRFRDNFCPNCGAKMDLKEGAEK